jgi:hypothetical protein
MMSMRALECLVTIATVDHVVSAAALAALTNGFLTGVSIPVDGGEHLV